MKTETKVLGIILLLTTGLIFGAIFLLSRNSNSSQGVKGVQVADINYAKGQKIGSDSAKVRLVEFSDFQCPACHQAESAIKQVLTAYQGDVQLIYRHFPLPQHVIGRKAAYLSEAASNEGKFWETHDKLFETQSQWTVMAEKDAQNYFLSLTRELGLDENKMREGMEGNSFKAIIEEDVLEGRRLGVNATPTFFLNGYKLNLKNFADLIATVEAELKK